MLGIALSLSSSPLPNDPDDTDGGLGNDYQNYPVLTSATLAAGALTVTGTLDYPQKD